MFGALRRLARPAAGLAAAGHLSSGAAQLAGCDPREPEGAGTHRRGADKYGCEIGASQTLGSTVTFSKEIVVLGLPIRAHACDSTPRLRRAPTGSRAC